MTIATERSDSHEETTYTTIREKDSVYVVDSIYVYASQELVRETRWRTMWRDRIIHDTVIVRMTDTIRETRIVEKVVEAPAKGMKPVVTMGAVLILLLLVVLGWFSVKAYLLLSK